MLVNMRVMSQKKLDDQSLFVIPLQRMQSVRSCASNNWSSREGAVFVAADGSAIMFVGSAVVVESVLFGNVSRNAVRERVWGGVLGNVIVNNLEQQKIIFQFFNKKNF